jgi:DNA-3-methyladenine glycosylase II
VSEAVPDGAVAHLRHADPVLRDLIDEVEADGGLGRPMCALGVPAGGWGPRGRRPVAAHDHYGALVRSIVSQQVSSKAAYAINTRLLERFGGRPPSPQEVLAEDPEELRAAAGLSRMKTAYLRSLAEHVISGQLELDRMEELPDEDVTAELVAVKGIGQWTAHMFLIFHLQRPDVLPVGDLGVRTAIRRRYGLDELPGPAEMERIATPWRPYRSVASRYLWRSLDNTPV